ncbi:DUF4326 domain-containing protein [Haloarcula halophila]|uniref:DUF4326 domain-containing protein n=1 Tax=Haloarcula TaxID=2237 RepID=UPI0023E3E31D|nr:DUF4326 domain-containing protein [Halomicroarcula sp. DFY41]
MQPEAAIIGECTDCGGRMIETAAFTTDSVRRATLFCGDCQTHVRIEHELREGGLDAVDADGVRDCSIEEVAWVDCERCRGSGEVIGCIDDICHAKGRCIHNGNDRCPACDGTGAQPRVTATDGGTQKTRVGHTKADETDVYTGRGPGGRSMLDTSPGMRGWLGNPYTVEDHGRDGSIEHFRDAFEAKIDGDERFRRAVRDLAGKTLGCWCQRLDEDEPACHAEVIAEWADRLADDDQLVTDGGVRETHIGESGLFVPQDLREFQGQIVFRTPRSTIQHFGSTDLDAYYGMIEAGDFDEPDAFRDPKNPDLAPDRLTIKPQGEPAVEFVVETDPDVRCDGGTDRVECSNCGYRRPTFEACPECGALGGER